MLDARRVVGENVRALRLARNWTQEEFAEASGLSQQYISKLERGRRNPTIITLVELAEALGTTPDALLRPHHS